MSRNFDLAIIGTGVVGRSVALAMAAEGWSVAVIDRKTPGGTCALRGCDPKKVLVDAAAALDHAERMRGLGLSGETRTDWRDLMSFKRSFTDKVADQQEAMYREAGIAVLHGTARFTGANELDVADERITGMHTVIATGARPVPLNLPGEEHRIDHEQFMELTDLPKRIVFVGGGYITSEFASLAARAGAEVCILQQGPRILEGFDPDMVAHLTSALPSGMNVKTDVEVTAIAREGDVLEVTYKSATGERTVETDLVVHAAGRRPDFDNLGLEVSGIEMKDGRLALDEYLRSVSNRAVFAGGDAAAMGPALTPVASKDARAIIAGLKGSPTKPNHTVVPSVAFTYPPIATVGFHEAEARAAGRAICVKSADVSDWFTAEHLAAPIYAYKTIADEGSGRILGAHLVGPHAEEVINLFAMAVRKGMTATDLSDATFAYPTAGFDLSAMF